MKICIYGAGGAGCVVAEKLRHVAPGLTLIARGKHYQAMHDLGLRFITPNGEETLKLNVTDDPTSLPEQDVVILTTKAYHLADIAPQLPKLMHDKTAIIPACNGIPWWFFQGLEGPLENFTPKSTDPEGILSRHIPHENIIGGVLYMCATLLEPGVVSSTEPPRFTIGEPSSEATERYQSLKQLFNKAGFMQPENVNIRSTILMKLCWNIAFNVLSVIYQKTTGPLASEKETRTLAHKLMEELKEFGKAINVPMPLDIEKTINDATKMGDFKPSMFQDFEQNKKMEIDAIIGVVVEIADKLSLEIPTIREMHGKILPLT